MSRAPRWRGPEADRDARWSDARWSAVSVTVDDGLTYRVLRSDEHNLYRGLCDAYPNLSWQADNADDALNGIRRQVHERARP